MKKFYLQGKFKLEGRKTFDIKRIIVHADNVSEAREKGKQKYPEVFFTYDPQIIHDEF